MSGPNTLSFSEAARLRPEQFFPTNRLRFVERMVKAGFVKQGERGEAIAVEPTIRRILQQKFISNHGNERWGDIPVVAEDA